MRKPLLVLSLIASALFPVGLAAQGFGLGVKAGTVGVGVEGALALGSMVNPRAGGALVPLGFDVTLEDIEWSIDLPSSYLQVGLDLYPTGGGFRLMGGLLHKPDDAELEATFTRPQEIGGREYTPEQIGTLVGSVESSSLAPFLGIGFGKHTSPGFGFFADFGLAFFGEPELTLEQVGGTLSGAERDEFENRLETERREVEEDLQADEFPQRLLKMWPFLQLGLRIGLGG